MNIEVLANFVNKALAPLVVGEDPLEIDKLWNKMIPVPTSLAPRVSSPRPSLGWTQPYGIFGTKPVGLPICPLLGGGYRYKVMEYASIAAGLRYRMMRWCSSCLIRRSPLSGPQPAYTYATPPRPAPGLRSTRASDRKWTPYSSNHWNSKMGASLFRFGLAWSWRSSHPSWGSWPCEHRILRLRGARL